jgi:hypothetical protein
MLVKGGTVSDVLENVPLFPVDVEGNVSLRGSDNVRIFHRRSSIYALNMAEALHKIPADADKVEVITIHLLVMMQRWSWYTKHYP